MTSDIGDILMGRLETLPFIDKWAGVVKPVVMMTNKVRKVFPAATRIIIDQCEADGNVSIYGDMCPDSRFKSVMYLEDRGNRMIRKEGGNTFWRASFELVCWLNLPRLGYEGLRYSGTAMHSIIAKFPRVPFNSGIYSRINIMAVSQAPAGQNPFEKYSYDEKITQFLLYPYEHFSFSIDVEYCVNKACLSVTAIGDPLSCVSPNVIRNAIIEDQDGNVVTTLKANQRYRVIVASGIDEGGPTTEYTILVVDPGLN